MDAAAPRFAMVAGEASGDQLAGLLRGGLHQGGVLQVRLQRGQAGVFTLGEGGLDAAARVVQHPNLRVVDRVEALRGAAEVELDDLRGAGTDQEQRADLRAALEQAVDDAVEFVVAVGQAGEVALLRFDNFLSGLPAGIQLFSLLGNNPALLDLMVNIMAAAPRLAEIIAELETATVSERQGRAIDRDQAGSMEKKKREGYF